MQAKRWLSGLVACAMLVTMLPTQVFALESDAADTWSKTLNAEELYALIQDKLDENGSIGLADLADSEAGTDTNDGVQGTLTAVAFDSGDKIELSALADGDTSYTLTFTDDDTSEPDSGLPAETGDMTEPPQEDGQPVAPGATPADDSTASDTTSGTDPPTAEEPSAQGQEGTVDLRVTTQETYATEAEADAQAAEQGKDPEADVAVQTDEETGTVLGALLTVDEEQVDAVTLYYTAEKAEEPIQLMNLSGQENEPEPRAEGTNPTYRASKVWDISGVEGNQSPNQKTGAYYVWKDADNPDQYYVAICGNYSKMREGNTGWLLYFKEGEKTKLTINVQTTPDEGKLQGADGSDCWAIQSFTRDNIKYNETLQTYVIDLKVPGGFAIGNIRLSDDFIKEEIQQKDGTPIYVEVYVDGTRKTLTEDDLKSYVKVESGDTNSLETSIASDTYSSSIQCDYTYQFYNCKDIKFTAAGGYVIEGVQADLVYGQSGSKGIKPNGDGSVTADNVQGGSTVEVYLRTLYTVQYQWIGGSVIGTNKDLYIASKTENLESKEVKPEQPTTGTKPCNCKEENCGHAKVKDKKTGMQPGALNCYVNGDLKTKITLAALPMAAAGQEVSGWYTNADGTSIEEAGTSVKVSDHTARANGDHIIPFYAKATDAITVPDIDTANVTKKANGATFVAGDEVTYTITVPFTVDSDKTAKIDKFTVTDTVFGQPGVSDVEYQFVKSDQQLSEEWTQIFSPSSQDNSRTVDLDPAKDISTGDQLVIRYTYKLPEDLTSLGEAYKDGKFTNTATVTVSYKGVGETHEPATETVTVEEPKPELSIEKALTKVNGEAYTSGMVNSGDVLTYQITVKNTGNGAKTTPTALEDQDMWGADKIAYVSDVQVTYNGDVVPAEEYPIEGAAMHFTQIPANSTYTVTYNYTVQLADEGKKLSNTATLDGTQSNTVNVDVEKTHCLITYTYESGTAGKSLPDNFLVPPEQQIVLKGSNLVLPSDKPEQTKFETDDGVWEFLGWRTVQGDQNLPISVEDDMHIIGLWNFTERQTAILTVNAVDENGNPFFALEDWPKTAEIEIGATYQISVAGNPDGSDIDVPEAITIGGVRYIYDTYGANEGKLTGTMTKDGVSVDIVYAVDEVGGENGKTPDDIPDRYQVTVCYDPFAPEQGSVSEPRIEVLTMKDYTDKLGTVTGSVWMSGATATAKSGYAFDYWTMWTSTTNEETNLSETSIDAQENQIAAQTIPAVGGSVIAFTAYFKPVVTIDDVLEHFQKEFTVTSGLNEQATFRFQINAADGTLVTNLIQADVQKSNVPVALKYTGDETILEPGTYTLSEIVPPDDVSGIDYDASRIEFTITEDAQIQDKEKNPVTGILYTFKNSLAASPYTITKTVVDKDGKSADAIYQVGDTVYYQITVDSINTWPEGQTVKVFDQLPAGLALVSAESLDKTITIRSTENNTVVAEAAAKGTIRVTATVLESYDAAYDNIASVDDNDPTTDDPKTDPVPIQVAALDVQKTLVDNSKVYNVGDTVKYQITFKNIGNVTLKEFDIADAVPNGLEIVDSAWENGKFNDLLPDELQPGEEKAVTVEVRITDYSASYSNTATVTAETAPGGKPVTKDDTNTDLKVNPNHNVTVQYVLQDEAGKTVSAIDKGTLTAAHNSTWKVSVADQEDLTDAGNLQVPKTTTTNGIQYVFKKLENAQTSGTVTGNVEITVVYGLDEIGGGSDQKQPDGVPDEYQATVTYRVVNGTWSDGSSTDRTEVFTLYTYDPATAAWTEIEHVTLGNTIPTGMQANAGYAGQSGAWNTAITAETQVTGNVTYIYRFGEAAPDEIIVYYDDDGSGYGEITSEHRQVFTADNWQTITDDPTHVRIHLTATAEDDGGRTYFDEWQGSLVDDLDDDIREDEELSAWVVAEIGQTYTVIADFGRRSSGGGGGGGNRDDDDDEEEIIDEEVPLAETPWLNTVDHYAYIVGYAEDGTVRPNANITRAEVATIFFRLLTDEARNSLWSTTNTFSDVASTAWYNTAVSTMANAGIIQGYEDGTFRPNANITRAEFAAIAARFMTSGYDVESDLFTDIAGHWARESINDAATAGWINGYSDDTFRPDNAITRAEAVTLVNNVLQRKPDADHMLDSMITWPDNPESAWYYEAIQEATNSHDYDMPSEDDDVDYETWTALQENRDWAALEAQWSAEHAYGGDVM